MMVMSYWLTAMLEGLSSLANHREWLPPAFTESAWIVEINAKTAIVSLVDVPWFDEVSELVESPRIKRSMSQGAADHINIPSCLSTLLHLGKMDTHFVQL